MPKLCHSFGIHNFKSRNDAIIFGQTINALPSSSKSSKNILKKNVANFPFLDAFRQWFAVFMVCKVNSGHKQNYLLHRLHPQKSKFFHLKY
ncbi:hypothetical protein MADE_1005765 [Alteromonas mediterranea DE]|uniref:Uncharacterized protein n=1 Tax=Alteromonas mediterranea (strain DSM 17117 / CIP 110805 / LMG 28347 / Deep ecotype) TaxID=1774373 RepID=F2G371_ALTMD|nr:hypothetical protein MADE_1005765 [Alteromonas mediterranea DE]